MSRVVKAAVVAKPGNELLLAGNYHSFDAIAEEWVETLAGKD